jgi:hypothetical protein
MTLLNDHVKLVGVDIFVVQKDLPALKENLGRFELKMISNRGTKVWPGPTPEIHLTDVHVCRFRPVGNPSCSHEEVLELVMTLQRKGYEWVHIEKLLEIRGQPAFSVAQGE